MKFKQNNKMKLKIIGVNSDFILLENNVKIYSHHEQDCCESHYLYFNDIDVNDVIGLELDLSSESFFERIQGYGIAILPTNGLPIRIAGYGSNNGYYSAELTLVVDYGNGKGDFYDITECQDI